MPKRAKGLSAVGLKTLPPGRHADGGGLYAVIAPGSRTWAFRYQQHGRRREMGLGSMEAVPLARAREKAAQARRQLDMGEDPINLRDAAEQALRAPPPPPATTFADAVDAYLAQHAPTWRSDKTAAAWRNSLKHHAGPLIGGKAVSEVTRDDVLRVLQPLWHNRHETARKTRTRLEAVLDFAAAKGWRAEGMNPARWRGGLQPILRGRPVAAATQHYPALPWQDVPRFLAELRKRTGAAALVLEMLILTATRSGEVRGMRWGELDLVQAVWTVPATRTKAGKPHRVPLSDPAMSLLGAQLPRAGKPGPEELVFPGARSGSPLSDMAVSMLLRGMSCDGLEPDEPPRWRDADGRVVVVHGFRSTFRDWAGETTAHPREVVEHALAHRIGDNVERAYARGDLFVKRRALMAEWAEYCTRSPGRVVHLAGTARERA